MIMPTIGTRRGTFCGITNEEDIHGRETHMIHCILHYDFYERTVSIAMASLSRSVSGRDDVRERPSKLLEHLFHRLYTVRHKDLNAIFNNLWNMPVPTRPRHPLRSLEPFHPPHLPLEKPGLTDLDILNKAPDPQHTCLQARPRPSKRSSHPCQICDPEPQFVGPSEGSKDPCFEDQEQSKSFEQVAFDPIVCDYRDCNSDSDTDDDERDT